MISSCLKQATHSWWCNWIHPGGPGGAAAGDWRSDTSDLISGWKWIIKDTVQAVVNRSALIQVWHRCGRSKDLMTVCECWPWRRAQPKGTSSWRVRGTSIQKLWEDMLDLKFHLWRSHDLSKKLDWLDLVSSWTEVIHVVTAGSCHPVHR